ncbi:acyltransferase family protein [Actinoalloteichus hymeniacidonis]|uniref:Acyltransferase n=1 Tax=Actinoalloteichus hymeniacidonis TaxID=340345 RepID=A0AAC9MXY8_9PSEU|nr:acyltransferase [Actinoalloteichus hymeniacidonis]AOS62326.1 putative acyltransferase [Actinoalloteichus hymeniacidonis]MBB5909646.1 peptidoglycan/LPS O-acetylase OafA/YrhL [Actinoalloteichus hymeniacidonis]
MTVRESDAGNKSAEQATDGAPRRSKSRRVSWDVLRAAAIALVVVQHATWGGPYLVPELAERPIFLDLQVGASILMVISGYFICQTLSSSGPRALLQNRLVRIIPPMAVAAIASHIIVHLWGPETLQRDFASLIGTILVYPPGLIEGISRTDGSYWTIPLQVTAFLVTALLWPRSWRHGIRLRIALTVAAVFPIVLSLLLEIPGIGAGALRAIEIATTLGGGRVHLLAGGAALWLWGTHRSGHWVLLIAALAPITHLISAHDARGAIALLVAMVAIGAAARGPDWNHPRLQVLLRPVVWLAGISYGIYLVNHNIGYSVMYQLSEAGVPPMVQSAVMIVCSVTLGWILTRTVEGPIADRFRYRRKRPASSAPVAETAAAKPPVEAPVASVVAETTPEPTVEVTRTAKPGARPAPVEPGDAGRTMVPESDAADWVDAADAHSEVPQTEAGVSR